MYEFLNNRSHTVATGLGEVKADQNDFYPGSATVRRTNVYLLQMAGLRRLMAYRSQSTQAQRVPSRRSSSGPLPPEARSSRTAGSESSTLERLSDVALTLIEERGYTATSVRDITSACGVTPGAFYGHFQSKDELLYKLVLEGHEILDSMLYEAQRDGGGAPREQLEAFVRAFTRFHTMYRQHGLVGNRDYRYLPPPWSEEITRIRPRIRDMFSAVIVAGISRGDFRAIGSCTREETNMMSMQILGMCIRVVDWYHDNGPLDREQVADLQVQLVLRMVEGDRDGM